MNKLVEQIVNELKLQLFSEDNTDKGNLVAVYPGRFQPMGLHHYESYKWLSKQFGEKNTYIATSDKTDPQQSPFNFEEKKKIMEKHGVPDSQIIKVINPYSPLKFFEAAGLDPKTTTIVYLVGEKDMGRLRGFKNLMKFNKTTYVPAKDLENPYTYYLYAPHIKYSIPSFGEMSGTTIRKALGDRNAKLSELKYRFKQIMGWFDASIFNLVIKKLNTNRGDLKEDLNEWFRFFSNMTQEQGSLFFDILKKVAENNCRLIITTDHGTIRVENPVKVVGDRNTNTNLRYKAGKNLNYNPKEVFEVRNPADAYLPKSNVSTAFIFAQNSDFFVYPNNYNHFVNFYQNTFQHGGISLEEVLIPFAVLKVK